MKRTLSVFAMLVLAACSQPPERQIVSDAVKAVGGESRLKTVKTFVLEGEGTNGNLGQDMTMDASGQQFVVSGYKRSVDVEHRRARTEQTRTPNFAYFQGPQPQKQVLSVDGAIAYNTAPNGNQTRATDAGGRDRRAELFHHPVTILLAASDPAAKLSNPRTAGRERVVDVATADGLAFTLAIDGTTALPSRVVSMTDNTNLGDVAVETAFDDYRDVDGMKLPAHVTTKIDKYKTAEFRFAKQSINAEVGDLKWPVDESKRPPDTTPPAATVTAEEIAKGIWFLAGQSHHSVLVEFADHLTLIEAPQNDTRALAVIAKAKELRPDKPLTEVVNSHHHFDHSGGIRAAVSQGLTVITHKANAAYYQDAASRPHTIVPDSLAKSPKPIKIVTVDEELELKDSAMTMELYHIAGNPHADTLLMAYFPRERILVEVDAFSPGSAVQPYAANLKENISRRNLKVHRIVPLHGAIAPFAELQKIP